MKAALKSEYRKLFSVRSTYIISALALALVAFIGFYIQGYKLHGAELQNPLQLNGDITGTITAVGIFAAVVALLLLAHEYRYNTITYSLTATNSRNKFLLAKILAITTYSLIFTAIVCTLSPLLSWLGVHAAGNSLVPQHIYYSDVIWRSLLYGWGIAMMGLLITALVRNQVGAIASLFILPSTLEPLIGLLLKDNAAYLPFTSLGAIIQQNTHLSYGRAAMVFVIYLLVGWAIAWLLFLKRDAN